MIGVSYAVGAYRDALPLVVEGVGVVRGHADEMVLQADDFQPDDVAALEAMGCRVFIEPWEDSPPRYRNLLTGHCTQPWVCMLDHDEILTPETAGALHEIVGRAQAEGATCVRLNFLNEFVFDDGHVEVSEGAGKDAMLFNRMSDAPFVGDLHPALRSGLPWRLAVMPEFKVRHRKTLTDVLKHAVRNVFIAGGGDDWKDTHSRHSPLWRPLRDWCSARGILDYKTFLHYLAGAPDPWLVDWIVKAWAAPWHDGEYKAFLLLYNRYHPQERIGGGHTWFP